MTKGLTTSCDERTTQAPLAPVNVVKQNARRAGVELFLVSFLILFFELACIRWFGGIVIFLTFFTNTVLMSSFLGVAVGCLAASSRYNLIKGFAPLLFVTVTSAYSSLLAYQLFKQVVVDLGGPSPQLVYFGTDARPRDLSTFYVPVELIAGTFFALIAILFVGLGQVMGRRFDAIPHRVLAYTLDILGSLAGIGAFSALSYLQVPAVTWFAVSLAISLMFVPGNAWRTVHVLCTLGVLSVVASSDWPRSTRDAPVRNTWSPYYLVSYWPTSLWVEVNNMGHQGMLRIADSGSAYALPYLLNRDSGGPPFKDILIIGAGSGNDVAAALMQSPRHIDAVEIDPVLLSIGRSDHPDRPYSNPKVDTHLDDGRSFIRGTTKQYDLIVYALVDSLALHSGYSSIRLESFLFTEQAFRDIKARLKPGGVFALYNYYRRGWVVGRLESLIKNVFGSPPIVLSLPYQDQINAGNDQKGFITFLLIGNGDSLPVQAIRSKFQEESYFWLNPEPRFHDLVRGFGRQAPTIQGLSHPEFNRIGPARVEPDARDLSPTDDWPFLYLRESRIPDLNLRGMAIMGLISLLVLLAFAPVRRVRPNGQMFFLGAGFMLLETKGVVHMALLFGATWAVNSIVFAAILFMILLSNVYVLALRPGRLWPYYALLTSALAVNGFVPMSTYLGLPGISRTVVSCAVVFIPVLFAGIIFAASFRQSRRPDVDFGSNIGGIILGGLSENVSLVVGFNHLLWIAMGYYLLSALLRPKASPDVS